MKFQLKKDSGEEANFSIILPGDCNASCSFCFWKRSKAESPMFLSQLAWYLDALGSKITQVSITGGEPTISPMFDGLIEVLEGCNVPKVVLTTNGHKLAEKIEIMKGVVNHINISRHDVYDLKNREVFKTENVPNVSELKNICQMANAACMDVTINKVVPHDYANFEELNDYVSFIKEIGASALTVRKDYSVNTLELTPLESDLNSHGIQRSCPVCVTNSYYYRGLPVHFKMSLEETSDILPFIYEFIYHPNGDLSEDWKGEKLVEFEAKQITFVHRPKEVQHRSSTSASSGCGQSSSVGRC